MVTGRKLLLADDSVTIQKVVDLTFSDEGLEVITVSDGQQALEKLEEVVPDIVLADIFMPKVNGYELCEHIKRNERFRHIPVMLLVGSFEPFDEAEARRVGADDYLTKPFQSIRTLIGKVRTLLSGGSREEDEAATRKLAPPPEAEKENRSSADFLERSTADTAPLPDVHEEEESGVGSHKGSFADISMDDEMIETKPASDYTGLGQSSQSRPTSQYSAADLREAGIAQPTVAAPAPVEETVGAFASGQGSEQSPVAASQTQATAQRSSGIASSDDALLDLGDIEPPPAMAEADDFFLDLLDEPPEQTQASDSSWAKTSVPSFKAPQSSAPAEEVKASMPFHPEEATTAQPQAQEFVEAQVVKEESTMPRTGRITLEQLSPEVIDAIARRAVEQLSERVVEQIAWEVVPDLAELLIKRRLEEGDKK